MLCELEGPHRQFGSFDLSGQQGPEVPVATDDLFKAPLG